LLLPAQYAFDVASNFKPSEFSHLAGLFRGLERKEMPVANATELTESAFANLVCDFRGH